MLKMIYEYKKSLRDARALYKKYNHDDLSLQEESDKKIIASMIRDLEFTIQWLETGRNPDSRRGIDKEGVYSTNPQTLDRIHFEKNDVDVERELTEDEREMIEDALCELTVRERDAFMMVRVEGLSFEYAAELMNVKKGTLQSYVDRAVKKIEKRKSESLFLAV